MKYFLFFRKALIAAACGLLFISCVSKPVSVNSNDAINENKQSKIPNWFLQNGNSDSGLTFTAFSPRMSNRDNEKENCLDILSKQISMYYSVQATFNILEEKKAGGSQRMKYDDVVIDESNLESIKENIIIIEENESSDGTYIKAAVSGNMSVPAYNSSFKEDIPVWINEPPKLSGFIVGIGTARRHRTLNESLYAADINALEQILKQKNVKMRSGRKEQVNEYQTKTKEVIIEKTSGSVNGFYILGRFVAEDGNYYYSLAVAPK